MAQHQDLQKKFIEIISKLNYQFDTYKVFSDFIMIFSISLQNAAHFKQSVEDQYFQLIKPYSKEHLNLFSELAATTILALDVYPHDFLGDVYMTLEISNERAGQFFTPFYISQLMAKVTNGEDFLEGQPFITVGDITCGAGSMLIGHFAQIKELGFNPQQVCWYEGQDISLICAHMCFIQMSLLGMPGRVVIGDSLVNSPDNQVLYTVMHYFGLWDIKLRNRARNAAKEININITNPDIDIDTDTDTNIEEVKEVLVLDKSTKHDLELTNFKIKFIQDSLF